MPKKHRSIFVEPHKNGKKECQDIINYSGDSALTFLNYCISKDKINSNVVFLVIYSADGIERTNDFLRKNHLLNIKIYPHYSIYNGKIRIIKKLQYQLKKMQSETWLCATVHDNKRYAVNSQNLVCLDYFSSFKSDYNDLPYNYLPKNWTLICSTSVFDSVTKSAAFSIPYYCYQPIGLARNDVLFQKCLKEEKIRSWIASKTNRKYSKIVIYAPTFRDYEEGENTKRNVWGYEDDSDIVKAMSDYDAVVIAKIHSWQNLDCISKDNPNVIFYEPSFNFTIYDVMAIADLMITDYSSIGLDFILMDKPVIYNLYDEDKYMQTRGMCVEPIEEICGGEIVRNERSLGDCIRRCLSTGYVYPDRQRVRNLYFKYKDGNSCERIYKYLKEKQVL